MCLVVLSKSLVVFFLFRTTKDEDISYLQFNPWENYVFIIQKSLGLNASTQTCESMIFPLEKNHNVMFSRDCITIKSYQGIKP